MMDLVSMIKPTSKASLKQTCLFLTNFDVKKAAEMYDFLIKDMGDIPAVEAASRNFIQNFEEQANGIFEWLRNNEDVLQRGVTIIRNIAARRKGSAVAEPLPPINE